jgi:uncharacterized cupin superfamily protein
MANLFEPEFEESSDQDGFTYRRAKLGAQAGAHQVVNRSEEEARVLLVSEMNAPEVVVRPESGKLSALGQPPGSRGEGMHKVFHQSDEVSFWEGENPPP